MTENLPAGADAVDPEIYRPSAAIDPARLDYLWTLAERMARMTVVPMTLKADKKGSDWVPFDHETVVANVFAVVEQADRWNMSPMALLACASIVHGRLGFEGKVIAAVLESRFNIKLNYEWSGEGEARQIKITAVNPMTGELICHPINGEPLVTIGTVSEWKTTGNGSPWRPATYDKMLSYRGAREWARIHKPSAILGVLGDDELYEIAMEISASRAREVSASEASSGALSSRYSPARGGAGFSADHVNQLEHKPAAAMDTGVKTATGDKVGTVTETFGSGHQRQHETGSGNDQQDDGGQQQLIERRQAEVFVQYSQALAGMASDTNVGKQHNAFWEKNGGKPGNKQDVELTVRIFEVHKKRARGEVEAEGLQDEISGWIAASFEPRL